MTMHTQGAAPPAIRDHDWEILDKIMTGGGTVRSQALRMERAASVGRLICSGLLWVSDPTAGVIAVSPHVDAYLAGRAARQHPGAVNPYDLFDATQYAAWEDGRASRVHHPAPNIPCFPRPRVS